jgi:hypothetical protein
MTGSFSGSSEAPTGVRDVALGTSALVLETSLASFPASGTAA